jgi:glycosyltransferase involved in cell wall biosynthesis
MNRPAQLSITHFVENMERGGLERAVIDLIAAQREAGHECRLVCLFDRGVLADELSAAGVSVETCNKSKGADFRALRRARDLLRGGGVLHTHNAAAHYHAVLASVGLPLQRVVNTRHGMGESNPRSRREWLYRRSMSRTDYAVAVCETARRHLQKSGVSPRSGLLSIPNGIRTEGFQAAGQAARAGLREELGLAPDSRLVGTVGRLQPVKDQANLIRAFRQVRLRVPDAALVLVGDGVLRRELEALAASEGVADATRFLGDRSDVPRLLQGLDVFALSSVSEGYSIALLEACAAQLPIVATDVGGNGEIVRDRENGLLVAPRDTDALAAALTELLSSPARAMALGRAGRQWVDREGSFRTMASRYEALYRSAGVGAEGGM